MRVERSPINSGCEFPNRSPPTLPSPRKAGGKVGRASFRFAGIGWALSTRAGPYESDAKRSISDNGTIERTKRRLLGALYHLMGEKVHLSEEYLENRVDAPESLDDLIAELELLK